MRPGEGRAQIGGVIGAERLQLLAVARRRGQCREADIVIDRAVVEPILHVAERGHVLRPREPAIERLERRGVRLDEARRAIDAEVLEQRAEPDAEARIGLPKQRRAAAIALEIVEVVIDPRSGGANRIENATLLSNSTRNTKPPSGGEW